MSRNSVIKFYHISKSKLSFIFSYPEETMQLIAELSQDIAASYREKQKTKLQRTFVKASDAAGAKVKGRSKNCESV